MLILTKESGSMAVTSRVSSGWIKTFICGIIAVSLFVRPSCSRCVDGTYKHDGRDCCRCAAGQYLVEHCTENLQHGKCEGCKPETYNIEPTNQRSCEPCTSCSQPNDNLEEDEPCTPARNRKCRCRTDHYCGSGTEICHLCHPCSVCEAKGIKVPCTAKNNTECNEGTADGQIVAIVCGTLLVVFASLFGLFCFWHKSRRQPSITSANATNETIQLLKEVNLFPHLPKIADIIGWKDMEAIAIAHNIPLVSIESVKLNNPGNCEEQTLQLLIQFHEKCSQEAAEKLVDSLRRNRKNDKADKVVRLLNSAESV